MRHLLSIADLDRADIERILDRAAAFEQIADREVKKVPALRGRTVLNLFYEASTRTRSSFELAAKRLSADVVNFAASGSSVEKGESLKDTVLTLGAHSPDSIVIRSPHAGAAALVAGWTSAAATGRSLAGACCSGYRTSLTSLRPAAPCRSPGIRRALSPPRSIAGVRRAPARCARWSIASARSS